MFQIRRIDHVVIRARDLEAAVGFYRDALGCAVDKRRDDLGLVHMRAGDSLIDLISVEGALGRQGGAPPSEEGRNVDHLCLRVEPFDEAEIRAHLKSHGVAAGDVQSNYGADGDGPSLYVKDPEGNTVELKGPPRRARGEEAERLSELAETFISSAREYLCSTYLRKIELCLERLTDEDVWWRPNAESNSIGNLLLHLNGSTRTWVVSAVGGAPDLRDRQQEFGERTRVPRAELLSRLRETLREADEVLSRAGAALLERRQVRDVEVTGLEAVLHAVEHFSMHTGQIILLAKLRTGEDLKLSD